MAAIEKRISHLERDSQKMQKREIKKRLRQMSQASRRVESGERQSFARSASHDGSNFVLKRHGDKDSLGMNKAHEQSNEMNHLHARHDNLVETMPNSFHNMPNPMFADSLVQSQQIGSMPQSIHYFPP